MDEVAPSELADQSAYLISTCVARAQSGLVQDLGKLRPLAQPRIQSHDVRHVDSRTTLISDNF